MFKTIVSLALALFITACSGAVSNIEVAVGNDLNRTADLATKYGKPEVAQCATFLVSALNSQDTTLAKIDALLAEQTDGLLSAAFKAYLIADMVRSLNDPAEQAKLQAGFDTNCRAVAGQVFINLVRDSRKAAMRRF
jgi:hypothetical protein